MAPEVVSVAAGTAVLPLAVDVYGIGVIAWELAHVGTEESRQTLPRLSITGFAGFAQKSQFTNTNGPVVAAEGRKSCFWRGEDYVAVVEPRVPAALGAAIRACVEVQPAARPSAEQAQTALQAALDALCSGEG